MSGLACNLEGRCITIKFGSEYKLGQLYLLVSAKGGDGGYLCRSEIFCGWSLLMLVKMSIIATVPLHKNVYSFLYVDSAILHSVITATLFYVSGEAQP